MTAVGRDNGAMDPRARVKICGITRAQDAVAAERAGADAIGLIFAPRSRRRVDLEAASRVVAAVGPFVTRVGVFVDAPAAQVHEAIERLDLDAVQLHGDESADYAEGLRSHARVIRAVAFARAVTPEALADYPADAVLLDAPTPGSGVAFDWSAAEAWRGHPRLIVAGGLTAATVGAAVAALRPYAVDTASGVESAPGIKDAARVQAFVQAARAA